MTTRSLEFSAVSKQYDCQPALSNVSFTIRADEHTAILGPSGCGKSTLLRLLAGLESPTSGTIHLGGHQVSSAGTVIVPPHLRGVAMVFQDLGLWPNLSAEANVRLGLAGLHLPQRELNLRVADALISCHAISFAKRKPGELSGGEQQRIAIARAIAVRPQFLLLDEPFAGIDLITKTKLLSEIAGLAARLRLTVIMVSHDPWEATEICRHAIVLESGQIVETGVWASLIQKPQSEMLKAFRGHLRSLPIENSAAHQL